MLLPTARTRWVSGDTILACSTSAPCLPTLITRLCSFSLCLAAALSELVCKAARHRFLAIVMVRVQCSPPPPPPPGPYRRDLVQSASSWSILSGLPLTGTSMHDVTSCPWCTQSCQIGLCHDVLKPLNRDLHVSTWGTERADSLRPSCVGDCGLPHHWRSIPRDCCQVSPAILLPILILDPLHGHPLIPSRLVKPVCCSR